jgi:uncharacterized protein (DUF885 family)
MAVEDFTTIAERIVDALLAADPSLANDAGDHRFDDRMPDLSPAAVAARVAMLRDASATLSAVDTEALDLAEHVDLAHLVSLVDRGLFALTAVREHEWNPLVHNPGGLLYAIIGRQYAPVADRLTSLRGRLAAVPDALQTARNVLADCPRIHLETATGQFRGTAALVRDELPTLLAAQPALAADLTAVSGPAVLALEEFAGWCAARLETAELGRDPRLGRRLFEAKLWHTLDTELTAEEVLRRAESNLARVGEQISAAAAELGAPSVRAALDLLARDRPTNATIVSLAQRSLDRATAFVRAHDLVSLVDDACVIQEMPEYARGVAVAYCDPPGRLETAHVPTFYCIAPTPAGWTEQRVESFYREYNNHMVANLTVHEAMPGHFLQLAHARRFSGSTRVPAVTASGPFVEGWAVYAEELMAGHGFGGLPVRLQQLKMQLRTSINAILDHLVHCADLSEADGMALMLERGHQEEGEAAGKWRRALLTSTQLSTYFVGYTEIAAIAAARPAGVGPRAWHDAMLGHGSPAPRHLRTLLGL